MKYPTMHIDDWLDFHFKPATQAEMLIKEIFENFRAPAYECDENFRKENPVFCTYEGTQYRITGASRLGDIWLSPNFSQVYGYEKCVCINEVENLRLSPL